MRLIRSLAVPLCLASTLPAQAPAPPPRIPLPVLRAVSADLAAARDHTARVFVEPLVFGRVSVGLSASYTDHADVPWYASPVYRTLADPIPFGPCPPFCGSPSADPEYQSWTVDLNVRLYPAALSLNTAQAKAMLYVGEFAGFTQRRFRSQYYYYPCPVCATPVPLDSTGGAFPLPPGDYPFTATQSLDAVEPGIETGLRIQASRHAFVDVGGRWRLVRVDDPYSKKRPGQVDQRLVLSAGLSW